MDKDVQLASIDNGGVPCRFSCLQNPGRAGERTRSLPSVCSALFSPAYTALLSNSGRNSPTSLGTEMDAVIQGTKTMDQGACPTHRPRWKR